MTPPVAPIPAPPPMDEASDDEPTGYAMWEALFERTYGPNWRHTRHGRTGECAYCSGKITTEVSRKLRAEYLANGGKLAEKGTCADD